MEAEVRIAHLSDLHLDGSARALVRAREAVRFAAGLRPELLLVTGDVADHGAPEEYQQAEQLLAGLDVVVLPGNHDRRRPMRAWLGLDDSDDPIDEVRRLGGVTLLVADSTVPGHDHGRLAPTSRVLIEQAAGTPDVLVVALHHPPLAIGSGLLDPIRLTEPHELLGPLAAREGPSVVLCGHAHTALAAEIDGVAIRIAPGVASTLRLPDEPEPDTLDVEAPPGLALHQLNPDGHLTTHFRTLR